MAVSTEPTLRLLRSDVLFEDRYARDGVAGLNYDVSADGQQFLMISDGENSDAEAGPTNTTLILVENWFEELQRLVPVP